MLSVSIRLSPLAEGQALYLGRSCHTLKVICSDDEIRVSALTKDKTLLPCQLRITTPSGLFEPFSASGASDCENDTESKLSVLSKSDLDHSSENGIGNPIKAVGGLILNGKDFQPSSVYGSDCPSSQFEEDTAALTSRLSALTTNDSIHSSTNGIGNPMNTPTSGIEGKRSRTTDDRTLTSRLSDLKISETILPLETEFSQLDSVGGPMTRSVTGLSFPLLLLRPFGVETDSSTPPPTMRQFLDQVKPDSPLNVSCASCGRTLSPHPVRFRRVEECCEGLSSELSEGWFCHAEGPPPTEQPQPLCLFFDTGCFYLHDAMLGGHFRDTCPSCGSLLARGGRPVQGFTSFYCDKIEFRSLEFPVPEDVPYRVEAVWVALWGMIRSAFEMSPVCKLYLHSKGAAEETCLLLSVSPAKVPFFLLRGSGDARDHFQPQPFHPVRYLLCHQPASKAVKAWRHDFEVDFYRVSDFAATILSTCFEVTADTCSVPKESTDDGFQSALLPATLEGARFFV